jgi:hypothetical protein
MRRIASCTLAALGLFLLSSQASMASTTSCQIDLQPSCAGKFGAGSVVKITSGAASTNMTVCLEQAQSYYNACKVNPVLKQTTSAFYYKGSTVAGMSSYPACVYSGVTPSGCAPGTGPYK